MKIVINGERVDVYVKSLAYEDLAEMAWPKSKTPEPKIFFTIYETDPNGIRTGRILQTGNLISGDRIVVAPGLVIDINQ